MSILRSIGLRYGGAVSGGGGGASASYVPITVPTTSVASTLSDFCVLVDLSDLPAAFFTGVQDDGRDIRVTEDDGTTRVPVELVALDTAAGTGVLWFLASSLSSVSDTTYRIWYGDASAPIATVSSTYGRHAVWANHAAAWHLRDNTEGTQPDSAVGASTMHPTSLTAGSSVVGPSGDRAIEFDGVSDYLAAAVGRDIFEFTGDFTVILRYKALALSGVEFFAGSQPGWYFVTSASTGGWAAGIEVSSTAYNIATSSGFAVDVGNWHTAVMGRSGSTLRIKRDDAAFATLAANAGTITENVDIFIATRLASNDKINAVIDEMHVIKQALSSDHLDAVHANLDSPSTFYTVGTPTAGTFPSSTGDFNLSARILEGSGEYDGFGFAVDMGDSLHFYGRRGSSHTAGGDIRQWRSTVDGLWSSRQIQDSGNDDRTAGGGLTAAGTLLVFHMDGSSSYRVLRSTDDGETFTAITTGLPNASGAAYSPYGGLVELPSGKILTLLYGKPSTTSTVAIIASTDDGLTWSDHATLFSGTAGMNETSFLLASGTTDANSVLLAVARSDDGVGTGPLKWHVSQDGGLTWTNHGTLPVRSSNKVVSPWITLKDDGKVLLVFADRTGFVLTTSEITVADFITGTDSWSMPVDVYTSTATTGEDFGYPSIIKWGGTDAGLLAVFYDELTGSTTPDLVQAPL